MKIIFHPVSSLEEKKQVEEPIQVKRTREIVKPSSALCRHPGQVRGQYVSVDLFRNSGFVEFLDYFGRFSIQIVGVIYWMSILPPQFEVEKRLKRTEQSTEPEFRKRSRIVLGRVGEGRHFPPFRFYDKGKQQEHLSREVAETFY